ncbi:uncharacterized protein LOC117532765 isoform X1 [Gymnodraco acuticeps]|uniref:Uncharacterized protein LOC117532765 isoform X1 n=1 Tax=Gymnodraco acuticeps TaxID=8218 RepID=A0A6P8SPG3_GYMAC|nr:uncharacterized protein LOC117532765 isoform X1 [Gymnodraco acuticeps]
MFHAALELSAIAVLLVEDILKQQSLKKRKRRIRRNRTKWVKSWILQREAHGAFPNLCRELEFNEVPDFRNFARLFPVQFHTLEELITPITQRENTNYPDCISVGTRQMVTLRFLATAGQAIALIKALPSMFPSPTAPPKKLGSASEALFHVLEPSEDPNTFLQKRPITSPVILDSTNLLLAVGKITLMTLPREMMHEAPLILMGCFYTFHLTQMCCSSPIRHPD